MISTSFITGAGLKKCRPATRPRCLHTAIIAVTDNVEVLVVSSVSGRQMPSRRRNRSFFVSRSSTIELDDQVAFGDGALVGGEGDAPQHRIAVRGRELAPLHRLG